MGSMMRRENEKILQESIENCMQHEATEHIQNSDVIFLHAPGLNKTLFMS